MTPSENKVSAALRQLRRDAGLTQNQLATEIGIAPTSIYRYEAGSRPDPLSLFMLTRYAHAKELTAAKNVFLEALGPMAQLLSNEAFAFSQSTDSGREDEISGTLNKALKRLTTSEKIELFAFASFLKENKDSTKQAVVEFLLQSWREKAHTRFDATTALKRGDGGAGARIDTRRKSTQK